MFTFIKTPNEDSVINESKVEITMENNDLTIDELCEMLKSFLQACGFPVDFHEHIELVKGYDSEKYTESVELDLSEHEFNVLANMAHEKDITFNELVNKILKEKMVECKEQLVFDEFFDQLKSTETEKKNGDVKRECVPGDPVEVDLPSDENITLTGAEIIGKTPNKVFDEFIDKLKTNDNCESDVVTNPEGFKMKLPIGDHRKPTKTNVNAVKAEDVMNEFKNKTMDDFIYDDEEYLD